MHETMPTPTRPSDSDGPDFSLLLAAARNGDQASLTLLFERFYPSVERQVHAALAKDLRVNRPWLTTRFSTGDVVQEVFRSVLADLGGFAGGTEELFTHYLTTIVRNRLLDVVRFHEADRRDGRRTSPPPSDDEAASLRDGPATDAISAEQRQIFDELLADFDDRDQRLLRGRLECEREFQDLAVELGFGSVSATRRAFYAAHARLAIRMRQRTSEDRP